MRAAPLLAFYRTVFSPDPGSALTEKQVAPVLFKTGAQANAFRPLPQIAPDGVQLDRRPTNPEDDMGVHLGSTYALSLGFRLPLHMDSDRTPVASPVSSRRLSAVGTSAGAAVAPANSRKKKKKKRKR